MSYKVGLLGVRAAVPAGEVLGQIIPMARELRVENHHAAVYLAATPQAVATRTGLRLLYLAAPGAQGGVPREFFTERWQGELFEMVYNDQQGIFLWRHHPAGGGAASIVTIGPYTGLSNLTLEVDYPQKAFTNEQLIKLHKKPEAELTRAEERAVMEYSDAITIGLAHHGFAMDRREVLDVLAAKTAWSLLAARPSPVELPRDASPIASHELEPHELRAHDLARFV